MNVHQAKTNLSRLLKRAAAGEEIVIANAGKPVARLVGLGQPLPPRSLGGFEQLVSIAEDFDAALPPDLLARFEGEDDAAPA